MMPYMHRKPKTENTRNARGCPFLSPRPRLSYHFHGLTVEACSVVRRLCKSYRCSGRHLAVIAEKGFILSPGPGLAWESRSSQSMLHQRKSGTKIVLTPPADLPLNDPPIDRVSATLGERTPVQVVKRGTLTCNLRVEAMRGEMKDSRKGSFVLYRRVAHIHR